MSLPIIVRPAAESDIQDAYAAFETVQPGLGVRFSKQLGDVLNRIETMPELYGVVWHDVRAVRLKRFQFVVFYVVFSDHTEVLAVMHGTCDPSTWQSRV